MDVRFPRRASTHLSERDGHPPSLRTKGFIMGIVDKAKNAAEDAIGKAKEVVGDATNNKDLEAEGKKDQGSAGVKKVGENVKDTFK
jgi:uncharacterized protein YjbJ (UPF0337 family)